jgi:hypothetical protein
MEAAQTSETLVSYHRTTWHHNTELNLQMKWFHKSGTYYYFFGQEMTNQQHKEASFKDILR